MDFEIAKFINHLGAGAIGAVTVPISSMTFLVIFFVAISLAILIFNKKNGRVIFIALVIALALHFLISELFFKHLLADFMPLRLRPYIAHPGEITPLGRLNTDPSFPSSHMSSTVAFLAVGVYYYRKYLLWVIAFVFLMGFARIYNGMHYPSDVLAGAILGILYALAAVRLAPIFLGLKRIIKIAVFLSALVISFLGYSYGVEPDMLKKETQIFALDCIEKNSSTEKKFAQISDLHFTGSTHKEKISRIVAEIKKINPSAVFITGDFISDKNGIEPAADLVKNIAENYKVYAVFGNWDFWALNFEINILKKRLEDSGAKVLLNDSATIKIGEESIDILGVNDPYTSGRSKEDLEKAIGKAEGGNKCKILLAHSPEIIKEALAANINMVLVGHTHGGQVYIPFITERMIPVRAEGKGFIRGFYKVGNTQIYVNRGIGTSGWPLRFMSVPEITEIFVVPASKTD